MLKKMLALIFVVCIAVVQTSCSVAKKGMSEYDELVALVQGVQYGASNFQLVVDTQYGKIQVSTQQTDSYYASIESTVGVWSESFKQEGQDLNDLLQAYKNGDGSTIPSEELNLNQLLVDGALPSDLGNGFSLYVNAIHQAPVPVADSVVTLALMDTTNEAYNSIQLAGTDWNDAVRKYNTRRSQISGEVIAAVSDFFGFPLPVSFPYYSGGNTGPVGNPLDN